MQENILRMIEEITDEKVYSAETLLFEEGILDSFKVIELVSELEDHFGIEIDAKYVIDENFCTVSAIKTLITKIKEV